MRLALLAATAAASLVAATAAPAHPLTTAPLCRAGYYRNVSNQCVRRPSRSATTPAGATALCRDNTYSFSEHASGTCSHHGGVSRWIHHR